MSDEEIAAEMRDRCSSIVPIALAETRVRDIAKQDECSASEAIQTIAWCADRKVLL